PLVRAEGSLSAGADAALSPSALAVGTTSQLGALSPRSAMDAGPALFLPRGARTSHGGLPRRIARGSSRSRPGGRPCRPLLIDVDARLGIVRPPRAHLRAPN